MKHLTNDRGETLWCAVLTEIREPDNNTPAETVSVKFVYQDFDNELVKATEEEKAAYFDGLFGVDPTTGLMMKDNTVVDTSIEYFPVNPDPSNIKVISERYQ